MIVQYAWRTLLLIRGFVGQRTVDAVYVRPV